MQARIEHIEHFAITMFRQPRFASALGKGRIGHQGWHIKSSALLEEGQAAFVHEIAMLDTAHAALQAPIDGPRGIGVSGDIEVGCLGFLNGSTDLLARCLAHFSHAIADDSQSGAAVAKIIRLSAWTAPIAMSSRLRECLATKDEARPL